MAHIRFCPAGVLGRYVECIWLSDRELPSQHIEHMLPSGRAHLVIPLHDEPLTWANPSVQPVWTEWRGGIVHGPQSSHFLTAPKPAGRVMGVSFRPGAGAAVLGVPMIELADQHVPLDSLWGARAHSLRSALAEAPTAIRAMQVLQSALLPDLRTCPSRHPAVECALQRRFTQSIPPPVAEIQKETGYSARRFIEVFRDSVGLAPKHFYRIQRFSVVLRALATARWTLSDAAAYASYADQSHLSREFRELAGVPPGRYRPADSDSAHHHVRSDAPKSR